MSALVAAKDAKDFVMSSSMLDVRTWDVVGPDGTMVGNVDRIMLDVLSRQPRYLLIKLLSRSEWMLLPIGLGKLDMAHKRLLLNNLNADTFKAIPLLSTDLVTVETEWKVLGAVGSRKDYTTVSEWYTDPLFDASRMMTTGTGVLTS
jgi:hypothetical protein